jgi:hypothetical protein
LTPVPLAEGERVAKLLKDFGDDDVDVRDRAQAELGTFGHQFEATLSAVLKKAPPGEVRNRLQSLARTTAETPPPAALLSDLRAVEFLNRLNTEGAKGVLEAVAAGAPGAKLTSAAAAALGR